jgi:hypothetical protein
MPLKNPNKTRVDYSLLVNRSLTTDDAFYNGEDLFTGYAVFSYYPDNSVKFECEIRKGEMLGWSNSYHSNGNLRKSELCFGDFMSFVILFYNDSGQLIEELGDLSTGDYDSEIIEFDLLDPDDPYYPGNR